MPIWADVEIDGKQDEQTFVNFLQPIADLGRAVSFTLSDKQRGIVYVIAMASYHFFTDRDEVVGG